MRLRSLFCGLLLLSLQPALHAAPKVPLSAFVQEDRFSHPRLAPDGKHIAITTRVPSGDRLVPMVTIYSLPDMKPTTTIRMTVFEVPVDYHWVSKSRLVVEKGKELGSRERPAPTGEVLAVDVDGGNQEYLFGYQMFDASRRGERYGRDHAWGYVDSIPRDRNGHLFLTSIVWEGQHSMMYDIDSVSAKRTLVADVPMRSQRFVVQNDGKPRFSYGIAEDGDAAIFRRDDSSGDWKRLARNMGRRFKPVAFSRDDSEFAALYSKSGGPDMLIRENLATGTRTTLFEDAAGSAIGVQYGAGRGLPFAAYSSVGIPNMRYFDPDNEDARLHKLLSQQFPGNVVSFVDFTDDGKLLLFEVESDRDPGSYFLFNKASGKADLLFSAMEAINPDDMAERRPISLKSRDGTDLYGYLTMPAHVPGTKSPLVVIPHGGPHGPYDSWFFDVDAQFLASRGYAVLQVNFRGSGGRGVAFEEAGFRQWGGQIQDDLIDGVKWAIAQGEVDGKRVCAYGASFGGYAALMLAAREPAMFRCAVGYAGVYDLNLLLTSDNAITEKRTLNIFKRYVGDDKAELDRFSPVALASRITVPVLLVHGGKDKRAPVEHAEAMRAALTKAGRPPEWLLAPNESHGFYDTKNRTEFYQRLEAFLAKNLAP
jgi:dipeptidyl aminopeptidase/acylaminoacyl peptidase